MADQSRRSAEGSIQELIAEYEDNQTLEAHLAHDADKIEMLIQAIEYQALGADTTELRASTRAHKQLRKPLELSPPDRARARGRSSRGMTAVRVQPHR